MPELYVGDKIKVCGFIKSRDMNNGDTLKVIDVFMNRGKYIYHLTTEDEEESIIRRAIDVDLWINENDYSKTNKIIKI